MKGKEKKKVTTKGIAGHNFRRRKEIEFAQKPLFFATFITLP